MNFPTNVKYTSEHEWIRRNTGSQSGTGRTSGTGKPGPVRQRLDYPYQTDRYRRNGRADGCRRLQTDHQRIKTNY